MTAAETPYAVFEEALQDWHRAASELLDLSEPLADEPDLDREYEQRLRRYRQAERNQA